MVENGHLNFKRGNRESQKMLPENFRLQQLIKLKIVWINKKITMNNNNTIFWNSKFIWTISILFQKYRALNVNAGEEYKCEFLHSANLFDCNV